MIHVNQLSNKFIPSLNLFPGDAPSLLGNKYAFMYKYGLFCFAVFFGILQIILFIFFDYQGDSDVSKSYAYVTQELLHCNFDHALNPNLPLLLSFLAVIPAWCGLSPIQSCMLVSGLSHLFAIIFLFFLLKRWKLSSFFAGIGALLFATAPQTVRFAGNGWTDPLRTSLVVLILFVTAQLYEKVSLRRLIVYGIVSGLLCLARGEGIFFALILFLNLIFC